VIVARIADDSLPAPFLPADLDSGTDLFGQSSLESARCSGRILAAPGLGRRMKDRC